MAQRYVQADFLQSNFERFWVMAMPDRKAVDQGKPWKCDVDSFQGRDVALRVNISVDSSRMVVVEIRTMALRPPIRRTGCCFLHLKRT